MESDAGFWQIFADTFIGSIYTFIGYIAVIFAICAVIFAIYKAIYKALSGKHGLENFLWLRNVASESRYSQRYRDVITRILEWLGDSKRMSGPFSYRAFSVCLGLAVAYPMLFWLIAWVAGGSGNFAGTITLSPAGVEETSIGRRLIVPAALIVLAVFYHYFFKNSVRFAKFLSSHLERMLHGKLPENMARAGGAVVAVSAVSAVVAGGVFGAGVAVVASGAVSAVVAGGPGGPGVEVVALVALGALGALVAGSAVVVVGAGGAGVAVIALGAGGAFVAGDAVDALGAGGPGGAFWLTFYALLPVVNAFFDWLSLGASRRLIHHLLDRHSVWLAVLLVGVDLALALLFMGLISLFIPFLLGAINSGLSTLESPVAIPWQETLEAARTAPWTAGLMATAMIVTTLIPTAVHLFAALVSLAPVNLSQTKLAKTSDQGAEALAPLGRAWTALQSFAIPILFSWGILVIVTITLLSLSQVAHQGGLGDLLIDWALASGTFAEGLF